MQFIKIITSITDMQKYITKGNVRVLTRNGKFDIVKGAFLGRHVQNGYVLGIVE